MVLIAGYNSPQSMILIDIMIESSVSATNRRYKLTNSLFLPDTTLSCTLIPINIEGVSQTVLENMFCMIMMITVDGCSIPFGEFADKIAAYGKENDLVIHVMHEDIFNSMHRI